VSLDLFANLTALQRSLDYHLSRHSLIASNIANAETPGYRPLDLNFDAYLAKAGSMEVTNPRHLGAGGQSRFELGLIEDPGPTVRNDGNAVSTEREMAKLSANSLRYKAATEMLNRRMGLLKYAASDGQRR
jgi:flagellar basal-body rod protein FlgB